MWSTHWNKLNNYEKVSSTHIIVACGKDDDSIAAGQLSYAGTEFVTDLRQEGSTGLPTIG